MRLTEAACVPLLCALLVWANEAQASTYDFSFTGRPILSLSGATIDVVGQFETDGSNNVVKLTGNVISTLPDESGSISGLVTTGIKISDPPGFDFIAPNGEVEFLYSNTFDPISRTFGDLGVLFAFGNKNFGNFYDDERGRVFFSTYLPDNGPDSLTLDPNGVLFDPGELGTFAVNAVPEPSTWAMMILGFLSIGVIAYRKKGAGSQLA
jgi:PEP-CTERM motif